jgi:small GTP-binding protein
MKTFKIILLGDSGVGKSSLFRKYILGNYDDYYDVTMGCDFQSKIINLQNDEQVDLHIWDTAGQERFKAMTLSFYRNTHCYVLVFDTTCQESFSNLDFWYNEIENKKTIDNVIVLIGTKKDLKDQRQVYLETINKFINNKNIKYFEISSKTDYSLNYIFDHIADVLDDRFKEDNNTNNTDNIKYQRMEESRISLKKPLEDEPKKNCCIIM